MISFEWFGNRFFKCAAFSLLAVLFFGFSSSPIHADENFSVSLNSTYTVSENGSTLVQQKFDLTNKNATIFAKQYALEIGATKLSNIRVSDANGDIPANIVTTNNKTSIAITFPDNIVGQGKTRSFTIQFDNPDNAIISGNVLEVDIPKLSNVTDYANYSVTLRIPKKFGHPARVRPEQYVLNEDNALVTLQFSNVGNQSISALFGQKQIFEYTLRYNLANPTGDVGLMQIALPPDTEQQKMSYISLEPQPKDMERDDDGNWIATYEIDAQKNLDVYLTGKAAVFLEPQNISVGIPPTAALTQPQQYWESNDPQVQALAKKYNTPRAIYDYVVGNFSYNYARAAGAVERLGAVRTLAEPKNAVCQEFTDVFVAIARAAQIPARRVTGYAYTANSRLRPLSLVQDVLHAWPEYYDATTKTWTPVDPTWGNTTGGINYFDQFDFNHLVFAINGTSSTTPYSAGSYKRANEDTKDVEVKFGTTFDLPSQQFALNISPEPNLMWPFQTQYTVKITNQTGVAWYNLPIHLTSADPSIQLIQNQQNIDYILPFQTREFTFAAKSTDWYRPHLFTLTLGIGDLSSSHELESGLSPSILVKAPITPFVVGGLLVVAAFIAGSLLVSRRKR